MTRRLYGWPGPTGAGTHAQLAALAAGSGAALQVATTVMVHLWGPPAAEPLLPVTWTRPVFLVLATASLPFALLRGRRALGAGLVAVGLALATVPLYNPLYFVVALARMDDSPAPLAVLVAAAGLAALLMRGMLAQSRVPGSDAAGSTRWGSARALRTASSGGLLLGRRSGKLLSYDGEGHLITVAATRSGKGVGTIVPNLLSYKGSVVVTDPKGENYRVTARYRHEVLGQQVVALDPFGIAAPHTDSYNPMELVDTGDDGYVETAMMLADMMVPGSESFWNLEARALIFAFMLHAAREEGGGNLFGMRRLLTLAPTDLEEALRAMKDSSVAQVREGAGRILQKSEREKSSVFSTAQSRTHFLSSPRMGRVLERSSFRLRELPGGGMTVYLILPREHLATFAPWLRLMIGCCYHACTVGALDGRERSLRTLFLLDEFANLGYMSIMREAVSLGGGYGLSLWLILQDLAQLRREYRHEWESFVANSDVIQAFAIQDPFTSEKLARMLGETSIWRRRLQRSPRRDGSRLKADYDEDGRPLLRPEEFRRLHPARQVLLVRPYQPVVADKIVYYLDPLFSGRFDRNPYVE